MKYERLKKINRRFAWLSRGVIVLLLVVSGFWYWINIPPQIDIPTPKIPHPNGCDYFIHAAAAYVEDTKGVDELTDRYVPALKEEKQYPITAKEAWLKQNAKALRLLREGLKYPVLHPPMRSRDSFISYGKFRNLARALAVESHVRAERGDWPGAAQSALDGLDFAYDLQRGGRLIAGLAGNTVQAICLREMYYISPHLDARTARKIAKRIEYLYAGRSAYFKTMQQEKIDGQAQMLEMMNQRGWRFRLIRTLSNSPLATAVLQMIDHSYESPSRIEITKKYLKNASVLVISKRRLLRNYTKMMDAYITNGRSAYIKMHPVPESSDPATLTMGSAFKDTRWNWGRMDTYTALNMTMLVIN